MSVTILGSSFGAVTAANIVLTEPSLKHLKVQVISPTGSFIGIPAIPRLFVSPELASNVCYSFADEFKKAFGARFEHIQGLITSIDHESKLVTVDTSESPISYDNLIISTGTRKISSNIDLVLPFDKFHKELEDIHDLAVKAKTIAVIGAGATGTEIAAELGHYFLKKGQPKKVVLFSGLRGPLEPTFGASKSKVTVDKLKKKGVTVKQSVVEIPEGPGIQSNVALKFADGGTETFDLVISSVGSHPQSKFTSLATDKGHIPTDSYLRARGASSVYVLGDLVANSSNTIADIVLQQKKTIKATLIHDLGKDKTSKLVPYKPNPKPSTILVTLGPDGGVGTVFGYSMPSFLIKALKAKSVASDKIKKDWGPSY